MEKPKTTPNKTLTVLLFRAISKAINALRKEIFEWRKFRAIKKANKWAAETKYKHLVIFWNGRIKVVTKAKLKILIKARRFKKGTSIQQLEKNALYITT